MVKDAGQLYVYSTWNKVHLYVEQPDMLRELNLHNSLSLGKPSYTKDVPEPMLGKGIIHANGNYWAFQRKFIAEFFLGKLKVTVVQTHTHTRIYRDTHTQTLAYLYMHINTLAKQLIL